jgi:hypothetical protein
LEGILKLQWLLLVWLKGKQDGGFRYAYNTTQCAAIDERGRVGNVLVEGAPGVGDGENQPMTLWFVGVCEWDEREMDVLSQEKSVRL